MSIWGKVIGGVAGFALGGPLGALFGTFAGHAYDKMRGGGRRRGADPIEGRRVAFTIAIIVLSAKMAKVDGEVKPAELDYLRRVASILGFDPHHFERIRVSHMSPEEADPYEVLGLSRSTPGPEIKKAYRQLIRENHPDTLIAQGMPQEFIDLANDKMATINDAYDRVATERGLS